MSTKTALLMLDYQVALAEEGELCLPPPSCPGPERDVLAMAKRVLEAARGAGVKVFHVRLAFDPDVRPGTNRLARSDGYPANQKMCWAPRLPSSSPSSPPSTTSRMDKGAVNAFIAHRCVTCSRPRASRTSCSAASPPTSSSSPPPGTLRTAGLQVTSSKTCALPRPGRP